MRWCGRGSLAWDMVMLAVALALTAPFAVSQEPAPVDAQQAGWLRDSLGELQHQLGALNSTVREMHEEVTRSRAEAVELRHELEDTRAQLSSLQRQMAGPKGQGSTPSASAHPDSTGLSPVKPVLAAPYSTAAAGSVPQQGAAQASDRLDKLEVDQKLLEAKVNDQDQTKVDSGSKYRVRLSGIALLNVFGTRGTVDNLDLPGIAEVSQPLDSRGSFGATVRQSQLGLEVFGPTLGGARTSADVQFDFFGGFPNAPDGVTAGLVRMRTARIHFDWGRTSIVAGQDAPFFSPLSPSSLASLGTPALAYAGNLWTWTPQVRVEHRLNLAEGSSLLLQGGILDPLTGQLPPTQFYRIPEAGEKSGQPAYAARLAWTRGIFGQPLTLGAGGYYARQNWGFARTVDAWAGTADWQVPLGRWLSLQGEFYRGRAIGGLGAGLGRSVLYSGLPFDATTSVRGLSSAGGWSQLKVRPSEKVEFNWVFGEDYPFAADLARFPQSQSYLDASLARNQSAFVNTIYHARSNLLLSLEYRRLWTSETYPAKYSADHLDASIGVLF
jgi:hypothetical protein